MHVNTANNWRKEFGVEDAGPNTFFGSEAELNAPGVDASQGHVLRRAFDLLRLDGILCMENAPLVYFKQVKQIDVAEVASLHRTFWNHGGAPILVLIAPDEVQVYSGLVRPLARTDPSGTIPALVDTLRWTSAAIREFLPKVESGQFFQQHSKWFDPAHRVDRDLLCNLQATRERLVETRHGKLDERVLDALLCRLVFVCYLFDRDPEVVGQDYLRSIGLRSSHHLRDVLALQPSPDYARF